jgi:hypothetical protein
MFFMAFFKDGESDKESWHLSDKDGVRTRFLDGLGLNLSLGHVLDRNV